MNEESGSDKEALLAAVVADYRKTGSLELTAVNLNLSPYKTRKILITLWEWSSPFSKQVEKLKEMGKSIIEIADELNVSTNLVSAYLPYEKAVYNVSDRTKVAARSDHYRKRIRTAAQRAVRRKTIRNQIDEIKQPIEKKNRGNIEMIQQLGLHSSDVSPEAVKPEGQQDRPIRLRLVLSGEYLDEEAQYILKKYGESSTGTVITRDILVPADMTLHALHYAIQRLFGWQNSHLRSFKLPDDIYEKMTGGTVRGWSEFVGVLFRFSGDEDDQFWDDDYTSGSFNTWLKRKYTGPYDYRGTSEHYSVAQQAVQALIKRWPVVDIRAGFNLTEFKAMSGNEDKKALLKPITLRKASLIDLTLKELNDSIIIEGGQKALLERLLIQDILAPKGHQLAGNEDFSGLIWSSSDQGSNEGFPKIQPEEQRMTKILPDHSVKPVTHTLLYDYDFGDGWRIEITRLEDCSDLLESGKLSLDRLTKAENTVTHEHKPACIYKDGLNLMDDVGGLGGFVEFLKTINEDEDPDERESTISWAASLGWSKRKVSLPHML